jgi:dCTP deaminase
MSFWSSQTLEARLGTLITPPNPAAIDCNAVTLHMGREFYITPSTDVRTPSTHTKALLAEGQPFAIPAGQFAFLLSEETVQVPADAMAFISMKARIKFRGLVNVSGFHVDPGWRGPLVFSVFNAGPSTVHLQQGMPLFLIWYADLDGPSERKKSDPGPSTIPPDLINNITGELNSFSSLEKRISDETEKLSERIHSIEKEHAGIRVIAMAILGVLLSLIGYSFRGAIDEWWSARSIVHPAATRTVPPASTAVPDPAPPAQRLPDRSPIAPSVKKP